MLERDLGGHGDARRGARRATPRLGAAVRTARRASGTGCCPSCSRPVLRPPRHPILMARFGLPALLPATALARLAFREPAARALFAGMAAHSMLRLGQPLSASFGLVLGLLAHAVGWPMARGGSGRSPPRSRRRRGRSAWRSRRAAGSTSLARPAAGARRPARPHAAPGARGRRRPAAGRLPAPARGLPLRAGRVQGRLGARRPDPVARPARPRGPAPCTSAGRCARSRRPRTRSTAAASRIARSCSSSSRRSPTRRGRPRASTSPGRTATCRTARRCDATAAIEAQVERFAPGFRDLILARSRTGRRRDGGVRRELRRRRHQRRRPGRAPAPVPAGRPLEPVHDAGPGAVPVLVVHAAGRRRPRAWRPSHAARGGAARAV